MKLIYVAECEITIGLYPVMPPPGTVMAMAKWWAHRQRTANLTHPAAVSCGLSTVSVKRAMVVDDAGRIIVSETGR